MNLCLCPFEMGIKIGDTVEEKEMLKLKLRGHNTQLSLKANTTSNVGSALAVPFESILFMVTWV